MKFSKQLILRCFPTRESVLFNIDTALQLLDKTKKDDKLEKDRVNLLCQCHQALVKNDINEAALFAIKANYSIMAEAILLHWHAKA